MKLARAQQIAIDIRDKDIKINKNKREINDFYRFLLYLSIHNRNLTKLNRDSLRGSEFYSIRKVIPHFTHDKISLSRSLLSTIITIAQSGEEISNDIFKSISIIMR